MADDHAVPLPFVFERFSPTRFDPTHRIDPHGVDLLLDAARYAPSAGNSQPWSFIVGRRGDETHTRLVRHLAKSAMTWAPDASLVMANLAHRFVGGTDFHYSEFALYDLGQAVAHLTFQANALGLQVHQFRAFYQDALTEEFEVPEDWEIVTMAAVGRAANGAREPRGPGTSRERRSRGDVTWQRST